MSKIHSWVVSCYARPALFSKTSVSFCGIAFPKGMVVEPLNSKHHDSKTASNQ